MTFEPPDGDGARLAAGHRSRTAGLRGNPASSLKADGRGRPVLTQPDAGDALSRAQVVRVTTGCCRAGRWRCQLYARRDDRAPLREYALDHRDRSCGEQRPVSLELFSSGAIRLLVAGQPLAPFDSPNAVVEPSSATAGDFIFDVPPSTRRVLLRVVEPESGSRPSTCHRRSDACGLSPMDSGLLSSDGTPPSRDRCRAGSGSCCRAAGAPRGRTRD